jgi:RNA-directed DNA polymerase
MTVQGMICAGAPSHESVTWHGIDWARCHREVRRLQARIVKATREGRHGRVKSLQWLLTHSFSGKALAVRRVTENQGKKTPGGWHYLVYPGSQVSKPTGRCVRWVSRP